MGSGYNPRNYLLVHNDKGGGSLDPAIIQVGFVCWITN